MKREASAPVAVKREAGPAGVEAAAGKPPIKNIKIQVKTEEADTGCDDEVQEPTSQVGRCKLTPVEARVERD